MKITRFGPPGYLRMASPRPSLDGGVSSPLAAPSDSLVLSPVPPSQPVSATAVAASAVGGPAGAVLAMVTRDEVARRLEEVPYQLHLKKWIRLPYTSPFKSVTSRGAAPKIADGKSSDRLRVELGGGLRPLRDVEDLAALEALQTGQTSGEMNSAGLLMHQWRQAGYRFLRDGREVEPYVAYVALAGREELAEGEQFSPIEVVHQGLPLARLTPDSFSDEEVQKSRQWLRGPRMSPLPDLGPTLAGLGLYLASRGFDSSRSLREIEQGELLGSYHDRAQIGAFRAAHDKMQSNRVGPSERMQRLAEIGERAGDSTLAERIDFARKAGLLERHAGPEFRDALWEAVGKSLDAGHDFAHTGQWVRRFLEAASQGGRDTDAQKAEVLRYAARQLLHAPDAHAEFYLELLSNGYHPPRAAEFLEKMLEPPLSQGFQTFRDLGLVGAAKPLNQYAVKHAAVDAFVSCTRAGQGAKEAVSFVRQVADALIDRKREEGPASEAFQHLGAHLAADPPGQQFFLELLQEGFHVEQAVEFAQALEEPVGESTRPERFQAFRDMGLMESKPPLNGYGVMRAALAAYQKLQNLDALRPLGKVLAERKVSKDEAKAAYAALADLPEHETFLHALEAGWSSQEARALADAPGSSGEKKQLVDGSGKSTYKGKRSELLALYAGQEDPELRRFCLDLEGDGFHLNRIEEYLGQVREPAGDTTLAERASAFRDLGLVGGEKPLNKYTAIGSIFAAYRATVEAGHDPALQPLIERYREKGADRLESVFKAVAQRPVDATQMEAVLTLLDAGRPLPAALAVARELEDPGEAASLADCCGDSAEAAGAAAAVFTSRGKEELKALLALLAESPGVTDEKQVEALRYYAQLSEGSADALFLDMLRARFDAHRAVEFSKAVGQDGVEAFRSLQLLDGSEPYNSYSVKSAVWKSFVAEQEAGSPDPLATLKRLQQLKLTADDAVKLFDGYAENLAGRPGAVDGVGNLLGSGQSIDFALAVLKEAPPGVPLDQCLPLLPREPATAGATMKLLRAHGEQGGALEDLAALLAPLDEAVTKGGREGRTEAISHYADLLGSPQRVEFFLELVGGKFHIPRAVTTSELVAAEAGETTLAERVEAYRKLDLVGAPGPLSYYDAKDALFTAYLSERAAGTAPVVALDRVSRFATGLAGLTKETAAAVASSFGEGLAGRSDKQSLLTELVGDLPDADRPAAARALARTQAPLNDFREGVLQFRTALDGARDTSTEVRAEEWSFFHDHLSNRPAARVLHQKLLDARFHPNQGRRFTELVLTPLAATTVAERALAFEEMRLVNSGTPYSNYGIKEAVWNAFREQVEAGLTPATAARLIGRLVKGFIDNKRDDQAQTEAFFEFYRRDLLREPAARELAIRMAEGGYHPPRVEEFCGLVSAELADSTLSDRVEAFKSLGLIGAEKPLSYYSVKQKCWDSFRGLVEQGGLSLKEAPEALGELVTAMAEAKLSEEKAEQCLGQASGESAAGVSLLASLVRHGVGVHDKALEAFHRSDEAEGFVALTGAIAAHARMYGSEDRARLFESFAEESGARAEFFLKLVGTGYHQGHVSEFLELLSRALGPTEFSERVSLFEQLGLLDGDAPYDNYEVKREAFTSLRARIERGMAPDAAVDHLRSLQAGLAPLGLSKSELAAAFRLDQEHLAVRPERQQRFLALLGEGLSLEVAAEWAEALSRPCGDLGLEHRMAALETLGLRDPQGLLAQAVARRSVYRAFTRLVQLGEPLDTVVGTIQSVVNHFQDLGASASALARHLDETVATLVAARGGDTGGTIVRSADQVVIGGISLGRRS